MRPTTEGPAGSRRRGLSCAARRRWDGRHPEEAARSPTITAIDQIDIDVSAAFIALGAARHAWTHCPSTENARLVTRAEADVNDLLDMRFASQQ